MFYLKILLLVVVVSHEIRLGKNARLLKELSRNDDGEIRFSDLRKSGNGDEEYDELPQNREPRWSGRLLRNSEYENGKDLTFDEMEDDLCVIRFYKRQHYQDPTPYSFDGIKKPRAMLKEKSIRVFGDCCWRVFKYVCLLYIVT